MAALVRRASAFWLLACYSTASIAALLLHLQSTQTGTVLQVASSLLDEAPTRGKGSLAGTAEQCVSSRSSWTADGCTCRQSLGTGDQCIGTQTGSEAGTLDDITSRLLLNNAAFACFLLGAYSVKYAFLRYMTPYESKRMVERLLKFTVFKFVFLSTTFDLVSMGSGSKWVVWLLGVGYVKAMAGLARDRFESLMSSPSANLHTHARHAGPAGPAAAADAGVDAPLRAHVVPPHPHRAAVLDLRHCHPSPWSWGRPSPNTGCSSGRSGCRRARERRSRGRAAGPSSSTWTWWGTLRHTCSGCLHYLHLWCLHGFHFSVVDIVVFLDIRALCITLLSRIRVYMLYRKATHNLHQFRDASGAELEDADDCAICKESMQAAKVLPCSHIFHLACLRAWLQQSGSDNFSCPLCRLPLLSPVGAEAEGTGPAPSVDPFPRSSHPLYGNLGTSYEQGRQWAEETIFSSFNGGGTTSRTAETAQEVGTTDAAAAEARQANQMGPLVTLTVIPSEGEVLTHSGMIAAAIPHFLTHTLLAPRSTRHVHREAANRGRRPGPPGWGTQSARVGADQSLAGESSPPESPTRSSVGSVAPPGPLGHGGIRSASSTPTRAGRRAGVPRVPRGPGGGQANGNASMFWNLVTFVGQRLDALGFNAATHGGSREGGAPSGAGPSAAPALVVPQTGPPASRTWPDTSTIAAVKEVLPHAPDQAIVSELVRTRDVNRAVENLIAAGLM
eukprot:jgi/Botrbrau1/20478/Bobra.145_2s0038.1